MGIIPKIKDIGRAMKISTMKSEDRLGGSLTIHSVQNKSPAIAQATRNIVMFPSRLLTLVDIPHPPQT